MDRWRSGKRAGLQSRYPWVRIPSRSSYVFATCRIQGRYLVQIRCNIKKALLSPLTELVHVPASATLRTIALIISFSTTICCWNDPGKGSNFLGIISPAGMNAVDAFSATAPTSGRTYYLAPSADGGSDGNSGLTARSPWLSPHHQLNCGDVIVAKPGFYSNANFYTGRWGRVNCPGGNNVAWLSCETFDGCKINASANQGMWIDQSYWGVQGWEITTSASNLYGTCFIA